jgi:hypothetical protein
MYVTAQQFAILRRKAAEYPIGWSISPSRGIFGCEGWGWNLPEAERQYFLGSFWEELTDRVLWIRPCGGGIWLAGSYLVIPAWGTTVLQFVEVAGREWSGRNSLSA